MKSEGRVYYYDLIKVYAAFMVCFYHLNVLEMGYIENQLYLPNLNKMIMNFCAMSVPLFFMVNGSLLLGKEYSLKEVILRTIKLLILYYSWVIIIAVVCSIIRGDMPNLTVKNIILRGTVDTVYLWFLRTMVILTIILPILKKIYDCKFKNIYYWICIGLFLYPFLYNYVVPIAYYKGIDMPRTGLFTMYSILYYFLGRKITEKINYIGVSKTKINYFSIMSIVIGWILVTLEVVIWTNLEQKLFDGVNVSFPTIGALMMSMGVFLLMSQVTIPEIKVKRAIQFMGSNSLGIYILHVPLIVALKEWFGISKMSLLLSVITTLVIMLTALVLANIIKKIPVIKHLVTI